MDNHVFYVVCFAFPLLSSTFCSWLPIIHCLTAPPTPPLLTPSKHSVSPRIDYSANKHLVQTEDFPVAHLAAAASAVVGGAVRPVAAAAALQDAADVAVVVAADPAAPAGAPE